MNSESDCRPRIAARRSSSPRAPTQPSPPYCVAHFLCCRTRRKKWACLLVCDASSGLFTPHKSSSPFIVILPLLRALFISLSDSPKTPNKIRHGPNEIQHCGIEFILVAVFILVVCRFPVQPFSLIAFNILLKITRLSLVLVHISLYRTVVI